LEIVRKAYDEKEDELETDPNASTSEILKALNDPNPKPEHTHNQIIMLSEKGLSLFDFNQKEKDNLSIFKKLLGPPAFNADEEEKSKKRSPIGVVNVLTVSGFVGHVLTVECVQDLSSPNKKGNFTMSGNLQTVIQESVNIAKINAHNYLTEDQIREQAQKNIHIHFTEAATPKDGPSAGISICTAYLSFALNKPIPGNISMTGELSSSGEVCKIGPT
jgi:Lon-like ATP-dependent protease